MEIEKYKLINVVWYCGFLTQDLIYILGELRPRPHGCVFKSFRFHFTENAMKVLRPHNRFHIVLPDHTETMKTTENAINLLLRMCRRRCLNSYKLNRSEIPIKNNNTFSVDILHLGIFK